MLSDVFKSFLDYLKLSPRYLFAIVFICALLLFSPQSIQHTIGIISFVDGYRQWFGVVFVIALGLWVVAVITSALEYAKKQWRRWRLRQRIVTRLQDLTEPEKQILRYYFEKNTRGNKLRIESGDVQSLVQAGIIYQSAGLGSILEGFAHNIHDVAWDYIQKNPDVLKGSTDTYHTDERIPYW